MSSQYHTPTTSDESAAFQGCGEKAVPRILEHGVKTVV